VTKALGIDPTITADLQEDLVLKGDIYLLCSDGLTDLLITKANQNGGKDNISVILCRVNEDFSESRGWFKKLIEWF